MEAVSVGTEAGGEWRRVRKDEREKKEVEDNGHRLLLVVILR